MSSSSKRLTAVATTISFDTFWRWLGGHVNCILRAGTPEAVLFDHEDFLRVRSRALTTDLEELFVFGIAAWRQLEPVSKHLADTIVAEEFDSGHDLALRASCFIGVGAA